MGSRSRIISLQGQRRADVRQRQDAALFGRLDGIRPQALEIDARDLGVPREDRLQAGRAHFDRLLRHVVEAGVFEGSEPVMQVEGAGLGPGAGADGRARGCVFQRPRAFPAIRRHGR